MFIYMWFCLIRVPKNINKKVDKMKYIKTEMSHSTHDFFLFHFNGLKSVVTILAEATPLFQQINVIRLSYLLLFISFG